MRELIVVERSTVTEYGKPMLHERRYHGVLQADGGFRLLAYVFMRVPADRPAMRSRYWRTTRKEDDAA